MFKFLDRYFELFSIAGCMRFAIAYALFSTASIIGFLHFGKLSGWTANYIELKLGFCSVAFSLFTCLAIYLAIKYKIKGEPEPAYGSLRYEKRIRQESKETYDKYFR